MSQPFDPMNDAKPPSNVQTAGICMLIGGIMATMVSALVLLSTLCIWIFAIYGLVAGIMAIISATKLLGKDARGSGAPTTQAILLIINIINFDTIGLIMGIISLVLLSDEETKAYLNGEEGVLS